MEHPVCEETERDVVGTKKLIYQLAKSYRNSNARSQPKLKIRMRSLQNQQRITHWTYYLSNLLNAGTQAERRTSTGRAVHVNAGTFLLFYTA